MKKIISFFRRDKVTIKDVAVAKPSAKTERVINNALKRAYEEQKIVSDKAEYIRSK